MTGAPQPHPHAVRRECADGLPTHAVRRWITVERWSVRNLGRAPPCRSSSCTVAAASGDLGERGRRRPVADAREPPSILCTRSDGVVTYGRRGSSAPRTESGAPYDRWAAPVSSPFSWLKDGESRLRVARRTRLQPTLAHSLGCRPPDRFGPAVRRAATVHAASPGHIAQLLELRVRPAPQRRSLRSQSPVFAMILPDLTASTSRW